LHLEREVLLHVLDNHHLMRSSQDCVSAGLN
jgi:hypothetical protein